MKAILILLLGINAYAEQFKVDQYVPSQSLIESIQKICSDDLSWVESVIIEGHTDIQGSEAYNLRLSKKRAETIKEILSEKCNLSKNVIKTVGLGELYPISNNHDENRRVEIHFIGTKNKTYIIKIKDTGYATPTVNTNRNILSLMFGNSYMPEWSHHQNNNVDVYLRHSFDVGFLYQRKLDNGVWISGGLLTNNKEGLDVSRYLLGAGFDF